MSKSTDAKTEVNSLFFHADPVRLYLETLCCQELRQDCFISEVKQLINVTERDGK